MEEVGVRSPRPGSERMFGVNRHAHRSDNDFGCRVSAGSMPVRESLALGAEWVGLVST